MRQMIFRLADSVGSGLGPGNGLFVLFWLLVILLASKNGVRRRC